MKNKELFEEAFIQGLVYCIICFVAGVIATFMARWTNVYVSDMAIGIATVILYVLGIAAIGAYWMSKAEKEES